LNMLLCSCMYAYHCKEQQIEEGFAHD
jgi:hypothetical protein